MGYVLFFATVLLVASLLVRLMDWLADRELRRRGLNPDLYR